MKQICKQCGCEFELTDSEIEFYKGRGLQLPKRCKDCRERNKRRNAMNGGQRGAYPDGGAAWSGDAENHVAPPMEPEIVQAEGESAPRAQEGGREEARVESAPAPAHHGAAGKSPAPERKAVPQAAHAAGTGSSGGAGKRSKAGIIAVAVIIVVGLLLVAGFWMAGQGQERDAASLGQETPADGLGSFSFDMTNEADEPPLSFRSEELLGSHYQNHGIEMGFSSEEDYLEAANEVVSNEDALHKKEAEDGDDAYYLEDTNEFVVVSADGYIRTYFCPEDGRDYFDRQ